MRIFIIIFTIFLAIFSSFISQASAQSTTQDSFDIYFMERLYTEEYTVLCFGMRKNGTGGFIQFYSTDDFNLYSNGQKISYRRDEKVYYKNLNLICVRYFIDNYEEDFYTKKFENLSFKENSIFHFVENRQIQVTIPQSQNIWHFQTRHQLRQNKARYLSDSSFVLINDKFYESQKFPKIRGCTDSTATNYNSEANEDDGSCAHPVRGCMNSKAFNYNPQATEDDGSCQARVEGCTDPTATNYNPNANIHMEDQCIYPALPPTPSIPQDITGYITTSQVSSGATSWTSTVTLNVTDAVLDYNSIQLWDQFIATSATTEGNKIIITFRKFNNQRLDVECNNYEYTIPREAITTENGSKNINPITGNFTVVGCKDTPTKNENEDDENQNNKQKHENTIKDNNFYLSLYDTDEKGKVYINLTSVVYILGFLAFFLILFFVLFGFIKNSFLGRSKK